jgi:hypothetical protein
LIYILIITCRHMSQCRILNMLMVHIHIGILKTQMVLNLRIMNFLKNIKGEDYCNID